MSSEIYKKKIEKLRRRCERLKKQYSTYESGHNALAQSSWRNNTVLSGNPESVSENVLEKSVKSVFIERHDIEACHRFGKPDGDKKRLRVLWTEKTARKFYPTTSKPDGIDCNKHNFTQNIKIFGNEKLTPMNELIAHNCRRLNPSDFIQVASDMAFSESGRNVGRKIDLWRFSKWVSFMGFFLTLILVMQMTRMAYFLMSHK